MIEPHPFAREIVWNKIALDALAPHVSADKIESTLSLFATNLSQGIRAMRKTSPNALKMRHEIHDLLSASGFLGFEKLYRACADVLAESKPSAARRRVLVLEMENAYKELRRHLTAPGA